MLASFIVLNMMIALILEEYSKAVSREGHRVSTDDAESFTDAWAKYDPYASGRMHVRHLHAFMRSLPPPLGLDKRQFPFGHIRDTDISKQISQLADVQAYVNNATGAPEVTFTEVLNACTKEVYREVESSLGEMQESKAVMALKLMANQAKQELTGATTKPKNNLVELHSVCVIQRRWTNAAVPRARKNAETRREAICMRLSATMVPPTAATHAVLTSRRASRAHPAHRHPPSSAPPPSAGCTVRVVPQVPPTFVGRVSHSTVLWRGRLFVFGGRGEHGPLRDFWEFSFNSGHWVDQSHTVRTPLNPQPEPSATPSANAPWPLKSPHPHPRASRALPTAVHAPVRVQVPAKVRARAGHQGMLCASSRMLIIGGHDGEHFLSDVWECELQGLFWRQVGRAATGTSARAHAAASRTCTCCGITHPLTVHTRACAGGPHGARPATAGLERGLLGGRRAARAARRHPPAPNLGCELEPGGGAAFGRRRGGGGGGGGCGGGGQPSKADAAAGGRARRAPRGGDHAAGPHAGEGLPRRPRVQALRGGP